MLKKLRTHFFFVEKKISLNNTLLNESFNTLKLIPIINKLKTYFPVTSSSIDNKGLSIILNDIVTNNRKNIIEFGSGFSTILIAKLLEINKIKANFLSIEEDEKYFNFLEKFLKKENLDKYVNLLHVPIEKNQNLENWYSESILIKKTENINSFDCIIIDGPQAYQKGKEYIREPALPFLANKFNNNSLIFMDDTNRKSEKEIINRQGNKFNFTVNHFEKFSVGLKGNSYNIF